MHNNRVARGPTGVEYEMVDKPLDPIDMIDAINHDVMFEGDDREAQKRCVKTHLYRYAGKIENLDDVEAVLKTMIHYMYKD